MKKSISHLAHFLVEKVPLSFLKKPGTCLFILLAFWIGSLCTPAHAQFEPEEWALIGNRGNEKNSDGNGSVAYRFKIMKFEFTYNKYIDFLNAIDPEGINPNNVFSADMASSAQRGISFDPSRTVGNKYSGVSPMNAKPVVFVSWWEVARVANWLHNGAKQYDKSDASAMAPQNSGAYDIGTQIDGLAPAKNPFARYWIPTYDEWFKAAYYNANTEKYLLYGNGFDVLPTKVTTFDLNSFGTADMGGSGNFANFGSAANWNDTQFGNLTTIGNNGGPSFYGLFDMSGNAAEWTDENLPGIRKLTGGSYNFNNPPDSKYFIVAELNTKNAYTGFRLAAEVIPFSIYPISSPKQNSAKLQATIGDPGILTLVEKGFIITEKLVNELPTLEKPLSFKLIQPTVVIGDFTVDALSLKANTSYAVRAYTKTDDNEIFYSNVEFFTTNQPPTFTHTTSDGVLNLEINENSAAVLDILASDPDTGQTLTFSISGVDGALFEVDQATRKLRFKAAPDFETPQDQDKNNEYLLTLTVMDNGDWNLSQTMEVRLKVIDVPEAPALKGLTVNDIGVTGAKLNAEISSNGGGGAVSESGFVYSISSENPSPELNGTGVILLNSGVRLGPFVQIASGLTAKTTYAVRAFARNTVGLVYTSVLTFTTGDAATSGPVISYSTIPVIKIDTDVSAVNPQLLGSAIPAGPYRKTETLAGNGSSGNTNATGTTAQFNRPFGMVADQQGNVYIADMDNHTIRKMTPAGEVTTLAGTAGQANFADGIGAAARFKNPTALAIDPTEQFLYIADRINHRVRMLDLSSLAVTTLAGTGSDAFRDNLADGSLAAFNQPSAIAVDAAGNLVVTDQFNHRIRKVSKNSSVPSGGNALHFDGVDDFVEISNESMFDFETAMTVEAWVRVSSFTKDWQTIVAKGDNSWRLSRERSGNRLEFAVNTAGGGRVVTGNLNVNDGKWHHVAATFDGTSIKLFVDGILENTTTFGITTINNSNFNVSIGQNLQQTGRPWHGAIDEVRIWNEARTETEIVQSMLGAVAGNESGLIAAYDFNLGVADGSNAGLTALTNKTSGTGLNGELKNFNLTGTTSNWVSGRTIGAWRTETLAGNGSAGFVDGAAKTTARLNQPTGIAVGPDGTIYFSSKENDRIRKLADGVVSILAGGGTAENDGLGAAAHFNDPYHLEIDKAGNLYAADANNHRIRKITPAGQVSSLVGSMTSASGNEDGIGNNARLNTPVGLALDTLGNLYVAEFGAHRIRKINLNGYETTGNLPGGLLLNPVNGEISGNPTEFSLNTHYLSDFESGNGLDFAGETGTITPTLVDNAAVAGGILRLTPPINSQKGGLTIPASGRNAGELGVDFLMITSKTSDGADGLSYSFAADADASAVTPNAEIGTGSGLSLSFNTFSGGIRLYYGAGKAQTNTVGQTGLIAYSVDNSWRGKSLEVSLRVFRDSASVYVGDVLIFNKVPLPKAYADADKSTWKHVFRSRTGGKNDIHAIDRLAIGHGYGEAQLQVRAQNDKGSFLTSTSVRVGSIAQVLTQKIEKITFNSAESGLIRTWNGNLPILKQGIVWATSAGVSLENALGKTEDDVDLNTLVSKITSLNPETTYFVRAYAENILGVGYGDELIFTTPIAPPLIQYAESVFAIRKDQAVNLEVINSGGAVRDGSQLTVSTLAGSVAGFSDGQGTAAQFFQPFGVAVDALGNVYVADQGSNRIRKITPEGEVSTLAGSSQGFADGQGTAALFYQPAGVAVDAMGNVYVADRKNNRIRKITPGGAVSTLAGSAGGYEDGEGSAAKFAEPNGLALDASGNLYVSDGFNHKIRKITPSGAVSTLAGSSEGFADGQGTVAEFAFPQGIAVDALNNVYVADDVNHRIRKITPGGAVSTLAGSSFGFADGQGTSAQFSRPFGVAVDASGNVYVADANNNRIRKITPGGSVSTLAGSNQGTADGKGTEAQFSVPQGISLDALGNVYVAELGSHRIRKIETPGWSISPDLPAGLTLNEDGSISGTPTALSPATDYVVTGKNAGGESSYTIRIQVTAGPTDGLQNLQLSTGKLSPAFSGSAYNYQVELPSAEDAIRFTPTPVNVTAVLTLNGANVQNATETNSYPLNFGPNTFKFVVKEMDNTEKTYTVVVNRALGSQQEEILWEGKENNKWGTGSNWKGNSRPDSGADIKFSPTAANDLEVDEEYSAGVIDFNGSSKKIILENQNLSAKGFKNRGASNFVQITGTGRLKITAGTEQQVLFPVGKTAYSPVTLTNKTGIVQEFSVGLLEEVYANGSTGPILTNARIKRTWDISTITQSVSGSGIDMAFSWLASEDTGVKNPALYHYENGEWVKQNGTTTYDKDSRTLVYSGYTGSLSPFAIYDELPTEIQLTITDPTVTLSKGFDGTNNAAVTAIGTVTGILSPESVTVKATAAYEDAAIGTGKKITVTYTLEGAAIANYLAPEPFVFNNGEIKAVISDLDGDGIPDDEDPDTDGDGIDDDLEQLVPNAIGTGFGDGNGDGIADYLQAHVVSFKSAETGLKGADQFVTLATPVGTYKFSAVSSEKKPAGLARTVASRLPFGVTKFTVSGLSAEEEISLSLYVDKTTALTGYSKQANGGTVWDNLPGGIIKDDVKNSFVFKLKDNGVYDLDATMGVLKDPGLITAYPMIFSNGGDEIAEFGVKENQLLATKVEASDPESSTFTYGIESGADEALFQIDAVSGELKFKSNPDFENPADADKDNVYELIVNAFASNGTIDRQLLYVTVQDDNDRPVFAAPQGGIAYLRGLVEYEDKETAASPDENPGDDMLGAGYLGEATLNLFTLFEDQDKGVGNSMTGIAVSENTADADTEGVWEYSTDLDLIDWYPVGEVSKDKALLLDLETYLRFVPAPNYFGSPKGMKVHPVDGSGSTVNALINSAGGTAWTFGTDKKYYTDLETDLVNSSVGAGSIEINIEIEGTEDFPEAKEVKISGTAKVGEQLSGTYTFIDVDGDPESGTETGWFRSATGLPDSWTEISGATEQTYTLVDSDAGQYLRFGVRPNDGKAFGEWSYSEAVGPVTTLGSKVLTISAPTLTLSKVYDGTVSASVTAGTLQGVADGEEVNVTATASYADKEVGTGKTIVVSYILAGKDAAKYEAPVDVQVTTGSITAKTLTITATDKSKVYGEANPMLTFTYTGLVNGDTKVATEPSVSTPATASSNVGTYPIQLTGGADDNYAITLVDGELEVMKAGLTITATDKSRVYGQANPNLSFTYTGLVNGDMKVTNEPTISTTATANSSNGTYPITLTGGLDANYDIELVDGTLTVGKAKVTITAENKQKSFGQANPELTFTYTGLVNGDTKVATEPSIATTAIASSNVGTYPIQLTGGADDNYAITLVDGELEVTKAGLTITATGKSKVYGEANPNLTFTYTGLVNGDTKVTNEPTISTTATANSSNGTYPITLTGGLDANYDIELVDGTLTVGKAKVTITAENKQKSFGQANPELTFTYTGLVNGDTKVATEPSIATTAIASSNVGTYPIQLTGGADANYAITVVDGELEVTKAGLTITATDKSKVYGEANPNLSFTYSGLVNGDTKVVTEPSIATTATASSTVGTYPIELTGGSDDNYDIELNDGTLTVGKTKVIITAANQSKVYGESNPALTFSYTGLVNGDTKVATEPIINTTATASSNVGTYPIQLTGGADDNYVIDLQDGTLTIGKTKVTVTAADQSKVYGESNPALAFSYTGLVNGDTKLATEPSIATAATQFSGTGTYPTQLTGGSDDNYDIDLQAGTLTVGKMKVTITVADQSKVYGESNPTLTFTYTGLVNGDTKISNEPTINTTATASSNVGTYPIALTGGSDDNYDIELNDGTLTVGKTKVTVTAADQSKVYGESNPTLTFSYAGLVNGDTKLATEPSIATIASAASGAGTYPITLTGGSDDNYEIELISGDLKVTKAPLTIMAEDRSRVYDLEDPEFTYTVTGLVGADKLTGSLSRQSGEEVGRYAIMLGSLTGGDNYVITYTPGQLEILPTVIKEVFEIGFVPMEWGSDPDLPDRTALMATNGKLYILNVSWDVSSLDRFRRGSYMLAGIISETSWLLNPESVKAYIEVVVAAKPFSRDVLLDNSSFTGSVTDYAIPVGAFVVDDPWDDIHGVTLLGLGYDNRYFEIRDNRLFWNSPERVEGRSVFTIIIRVTDRDGNTLDKFFEVSRIRIDVSQIEIYNAFTPNGDGRNDTWGVPDLRFYGGVRIQVFERSGERVFYSEDPDIRWDGSYNGKEMPVGTYFWTIEVKETGEIRRGLLNLLRK